METVDKAKSRLKVCSDERKQITICPCKVNTEYQLSLGSLLPLEVLPADTVGAVSEQTKQESPPLGWNSMYGACKECISDSII